MKRRGINPIGFWPGALLFWAALLSGLSCAPRPEETDGRLTLGECRFEGLRDPVQCGRLAVNEDRAAGRGRKISIYFVRAFATGPDPAPDPMFFLAGGPGEHATHDVASTLRRSSAYLEKRDIVIFDQRGTGRSNALDCVSYDLSRDPSSFQQMFDQDFFEAERFHACLSRLKERADLTKYTTSLIADDINDLREALGYGQINLEGGSYGTRLALEYTRRHGATVRSAVLRGVAPAFALLVETLARDFEVALQSLVRACEEDTDCSRAFPDFGEELRQMLERVKSEPVRVTLNNPGTGEPEVVTLRYPQLVTALRYALYSTEISASLPLQVQAAAAGDYAPIAGILTQLLPMLNNLVAEGMWASVICTEEIPFIEEGKARSLARGTVLGDLRLDAELTICKPWPRGQVAEDFHDPVVSDVPVLLLSAEHDPASPLRLAEAAAKTLRNGTLVRVANRSHWGLGGNDCLEGIVSQFLENPSGDGLDLTCAGEFRRPPFLLPSDG